jgi:hypothetical protein
LVEHKVFEGVVFQGRKVPARAASLPSAQRADDVDLIVRSKRGGQIPRLFLIDENPNVLSNRVLLGDDAEAEAGELPIERSKDFRKGRAVNVHFRLLPGVRAERAGNVYRHLYSSAASTE